MFEDELIFVARLIQHIMEAVAAIDSRTRAGLARQVHEGARRQSVKMTALGAANARDYSPYHAG
jgi:hypothetical protein